MNLPIHVKTIDVFYDGRCGMCCTFHEWVDRQKRAFPLRFIPYQAVEATHIFPELADLKPEREMVVRTYDGGIYRGARAWVWCLYSCADYRWLARRLAAPKMLPLATWICRKLAANRHGLSRVFFRKKDHEVKKALHQMRREREVAELQELNEWREELMH